MMLNSEAAAHGPCGLNQQIHTNPILRPTRHAAPSENHFRQFSAGTPGPDQLSKANGFGGRVMLTVGSDDEDPALATTGKRLTQVRKQLEDVNL